MSGLRTERARGAGLLSLSGVALMSLFSAARAQTPTAPPPSGQAQSNTIDIGTTLFGEVIVTASRHTAANVAPTQGSLDAIEHHSPLRRLHADPEVHAELQFLLAQRSGWIGPKSQLLRGFADGQYNVTIDGIPFGDSNDFTHHTTSSFPAGVFGSVVIDRGRVRPPRSATPPSAARWRSTPAP